MQDVSPKQISSLKISGKDKEIVLTSEVVAKAIWKVPLHMKIINAGFRLCNGQPSITQAIIEELQGIIRELQLAPSSMAVIKSSACKEQQQQERYLHSPPNELMWIQKSNVATLEFLVRAAIESVRISPTLGPNCVLHEMLGNILLSIDQFTHNLY